MFIKLYIAEREREREQIQTNMNNLHSEISNLESNPTKNQTLLESKKKELAALEKKEKKLTAALPLDTQISILAKEVKALENKSAKTKAEEKVLGEKKRELE